MGYHTLRSRRADWLLGMTAVLVLRGCAGVTPIKTLLDDPSRFEGKTVKVAGEVERSIGVLGYGAYQLRDSTGSIPVVSKGNGAPRTGARIGVEGTFRSAFTLGDRSAAAIEEKKRYTP